MALRRGFHLANNRVIIGDGPGDGINLYANVSIDARWANDAFCLPIGTTAERPSPEIGFIRYNITSNTFEGRTNTAWVNFGSSGGTGGISDFPVSVNNLSTVTATGINIVNTATVTAKVSAGIGGSANIEFTSIGGGTGGNGVTWEYKVSDFNATANSYYYVVPGSGPLTVTLPAAVNNDTVVIRGTGFDVNLLTINDNASATVTVIDTYTCDIFLRYDSNISSWIFQKNGTVLASMPVTDRAIPTFNGSAGDLIQNNPISINGDGGLVIPTPTGSIPAIEAHGGAYTEATSASVSSNILNIDCGLSNVFYVVVSQNITTLNMNNPFLGQTVNILFKNLSGKTIVWPSNFKWAYFSTLGTPQLSSETGSDEDMLVATYINIGDGAYWYCSFLPGFNK